MQNKNRLLSFQQNKNRFFFNDSWLNILMAGLFVVEFLIYVFAGTNLAYSSIIILLITAFLFIPIDYGFFLILFIIPNQRLFMISGLGKSIVVFLSIIVLLKMLIKGYKISFNQFLFPMIILAYAFLTSILNTSATNIVQSVKVLVFIFSFLFFILKNKNNVVSIFTTGSIFFVAGCIAASILGLFFDQDLTMQTIGTKYRFQGGEFNNANIFGFDLSWAISVLLFFYYMIRKNTPAYTVSIFALIVSGLLTQSRAFYLTLFIMFVITSAIYLATIKLKRSSLLIVFILFGLIATVLYYVVFDPNSIIGVIYYAGWDRIINPKNGDISGERFYLWDKYINYILSNNKILLFGVGSKANVFFDPSIDKVAHNAFLEVIVFWGVIGLTIFLVYFSTLFNYLKNILFKINGYLLESKYKAIGFLPLTVLLLSTITGHSFLGNAFLVKLIFSFLAIILSRIKPGYFI